MRIAVFTDTFRPQINGVAMHIFYSNEELAKRGNKIEIFTPKTKSKEKVKLNKNITVFHLPSFEFAKYAGLRISVPNLARTLKELKRFKPDVIHCHTPFGVGAGGLICGKILQIPVVGTYHTILSDFIGHLPLIKKDNKIFKRFSWTFGNLFYDRCDIVITPSNAMKRVLIHHGLERRVRVISNGIELDKFYVNRKRKKGIRIIFVGRIAYEKNIDVLLRAMNIVFNRFPEIKLSIYGEGPDLGRIKNLAKSLGVEKKVIFHGIIARKNLPAVYNSADMFVTASTSETQGLVVLEAMACGLPVVGVRKLGIPELVHHGVNGYLAKPSDAQAIADYITKLIRFKDLRKRMSNESLKLVKEHSVDYTSKKLEQLYVELAKKKKVK